jgi:ribosomal protein S21
MGISNRIDRSKEKFKGIGTLVHDHENNSPEAFDSALKRFRNAVERDGVIAEYALHANFMKPSEKRRLKLLEAKKRQRDLTRLERKSNDDKQFRNDRRMARERHSTPQKAVSPSFSLEIGVNPSRRDFSSAVKSMFDKLHAM